MNETALKGLDNAQVVTAKRVATPEEAGVMIGDSVPDRAPTISGPTLVRDADTGELVTAYLPLGNMSRLRKRLPGLDYGGLQRSNNYRSKSQTFGYMPRRPIRKRESCSTSMVSLKHPETQAALDETADRCAELLSQIAPDIVADDREELGGVLSEWKMGDSKLWTSGVVNDTAQLPYHRDNFNYPVWSAMPVLRRGVKGGHLHVPEYDLVVPCDDSYAVFFKGKTLVHGVTPMKKRMEDGYRYSVVFYALAGMKDCFTHAEETAYGQRKRTERERDIARRLASGDTAIPGHGDRK